MKKLLVLGALLTIQLAPAFSQTVTKFKPDAYSGEDANIFMLDYDCVPPPSSGYYTTPKYMNFGDHPELPVLDWTWYAYSGCGSGTIRSLIRFRGLNDLINSTPYSYHVYSAELVLHTPSSTAYASNSNYPGTPFTTTNEGWVQRVLPGATYAWDEHSVTWDTQPLTDPNSANWVTLPVTNLQYNYTVSVDVTDMVQDIIDELATDPDANNGFLLRLQNEAHYRSQLFASSDHENCAYWPELIITYLPARPAAGRNGAKEIQRSTATLTPDDVPTILTLNKLSSNPENTAISPNPSAAGWNLRIQSAESTEATLSVYDITGRKILERKEFLKTGLNKLYQPAETLPNGVYFIELKGQGIDVKEKVVKN